MNKPLIDLLPSDKGPLRDDPARSYTLPARFYTDPEIFAAEKENVFYRNWWCVGHKSHFAEKGQYRTVDVVDESLFVVRDRKGELKAFYNICQHRGHQLLSGEGKTQSIVCPYHAWAYDLNGDLRSARNTDEMVDFEKCDFALKPVKVEEFAGFVFVNLDDDATSMADQAKGLEEEIRKYCPRIDELVFAQRDTYEVACNWKVLVDNFLECYHCDPAHKDFVDLVDMDTYRTITHSCFSSQIAGAPRSTNSKAFSFEKGDVDFGYAGWFLFPNLSIWIYPGETNISTLQIIPTGPETTIEYQDWYALSDQPSQQLKDAMAYQKDVLQPEDISLCLSVQKGLKSKGYNQGRFVIDKGLTELSEHAVHHFQKFIADALDANLEKAE
ncbi:MAG: aromatic ring-hydroxylating dioxygenase subunit alpha [Alphaproteobacteria bacterium]